MATPNPIVNPIDRNSAFTIPTKPGRQYKLSVFGTFDGATVTLKEMAPLDGLHQIEYPDSPLSAPGMFIFMAATEWQALVINGGGASIDMEVYCTELIC